MKLIDEWRSDREVVQVGRDEDGSAVMRCRSARIAGEKGWRDVDDSEELIERLEQLVGALRAAGIEVPASLPPLAAQQAQGAPEAGRE